MFGCMKVNETLMRLIVSAPSNENYIHVDSFEALDQVKNLLYSFTCPGTARPITGSATALHCCKAHAKINTKIENSTPCKIVTHEDFNLNLVKYDNIYSPYSCTYSRSDKQK